MHAIRQPDETGSGWIVPLPSLFPLRPPVLLVRMDMLSEEDLFDDTSIDDESFDQFAGDPLESELHLALVSVNRRSDSPS